MFKALKDYDLKCSTDRQIYKLGSKNWKNG